MPRMTGLDKTKLEREVARLDGLLSGVAALDGRINDYSGFAFLIKIELENHSIKKSLEEYYEWVPDLELSDPQNIDGGMRYFESEIRKLIIRNLNHPDLEILKKNLSFRVMEIIHSAIGGDYKNVTHIFKIYNLNKEFESKCIYFCLCLEGFLLFLQFNDDVELQSKKRKS